MSIKIEKSSKVFFTQKRLIKTSILKYYLIILFKCYSFSEKRIFKILFSILSEVLFIKKLGYL